MLLFPINDAITTRQAAALLPQAERELAELAQRFAFDPPWRARLLKKKKVHKRIFTAVRAGYLSDAEGYFLDAWNQPLWVLYNRTERGRGKVLVYSFGPNRRRDSDLQKLKQAEQASDCLAGDDLGFLLPIGSTSTATLGASAR